MTVSSKAWLRWVVPAGFLIIGLFVTALIQANTARARSELSQKELDRLIERSVDAIRLKLLSHVAALETMAGIISGNDDLSAWEFGRTAEFIAPRHAGIKAMEWIPKVRGDVRTFYEKAAREEGFSDFEIRQHNEVGELVSAEPREYYYPVYYVFPLRGNEGAVGFDLGSEPHRLAALMKARDTGDTVATAPIQLVQDGASDVAFLVFVPVYEIGATRLSESREESIRGFALGVIRVEDLVGEASRSSSDQLVALTLMIEDIETGVAIYGERSGPNTIYSEQEIAVFGRRWRVVAHATDAWIASYASAPSRMILVAGVSLSAMLAFIAYLLITQSQSVQRLVTIRTADAERERERAEDASLAKTHFLACMSHDLRTPLNSILGFSRRLMKRLEATVSPIDFDALDTIHRNGAHLLKVITEILDLSKIEAGEMDVYAQKFDFAALVRESVIRSTPHADDNDLILAFDPGEPIECELDRTKCMQMVDNLVGNAVKYTRKGGVSLQLTTIACEGMPWIELSVSDTGIGISDEDQKRLFRSFAQVGQDHDLKIRGTGLGLMLVASHARLHHGSIEVSSVLGEGSVFKLRLPLRISGVIQSGLTHDAAEIETVLG